MSIFLLIGPCTLATNNAISVAATNWPRPNDKTDRRAAKVSEIASHRRKCERAFELYSRQY